MEEGGHNTAVRDLIMSTVPTVIIECDNGNGFDGRLGLRVSSIFVIGLGSMLGMYCTSTAGKIPSR